MIYELTNKMIKYISYTFEGDTDSIDQNEDVDLLSAIGIFAFAILTTLFVAWWLIPARMIKLGIIKFVCKEDK